MLDLRAHYVVPDGPDGTPAAELRAFTHGLMPRTVPAMLQAFADDWARRGVDAWNEVPNRWRPDRDERVGWWTLPAYLGDRFVAPLLGAPEGSCIMQPHVHWTVSALLSADEPFVGRRLRVVCSATAFPSVLHTVQQWARLRAIEPVVVPTTPDGREDRDALLAAVTDRTAVVLLSHVVFTTGELLDDEFVREVVARAHRHGALVVLDGYHAAATMPIDVTDLGVDLYVGGLLKEASGSSGNAFAYVRPGVALTPRLTGWFGDAAPFAFGPNPTPHPEVRWRFLGGTTAVASLYHAVEGLRLLLGAGLDAVRRHTLALGTRALDRAEALGLAVRTPRAEAHRGALLVLEMDAADRLAAWLKTTGVYVDSRKGRYLRMAPFVWNTPADVDRAFDALDEALRSGVHRVTGAPDTGGPVT